MLKKLEGDLKIYRSALPQRIIDQYPRETYAQNMERVYQERLKMAGPKPKGFRYRSPGGTPIQKEAAQEIVRLLELNCDQNRIPQDQ